MATEFQIPIRLKVLQDSISEFQKILNNLQPNTNNWKSLNKIINSMVAETQKLQAQTSVPFGSEKQFTQTEKTLERLENAAARVSIVMQGLRFSDIKLTSSQVDQFKQFEQEINKIRDAYKKLQEETKAKLLANDSNRSLIGSINKNALDKDFEGIEAAVDQHIKSLESKVERQKTAFDKLRNNIELGNRATALTTSGKGLTREALGDSIFDKYLAQTEKGLKIKSWNNGVTKKALLEEIEKMFNLTPGELKDMAEKTVDQINKAFQDMGKNVKNPFQTVIDQGASSKKTKDQNIQSLENQIQQYRNLQIELEKLKSSSGMADESKNTTARIEEIQQKITALETTITRSVSSNENYKNSLKSIGDSCSQMRSQLDQVNAAFLKQQSVMNSFNSMKTMVTNFMGFYQVLNLTKKAIKDAANHIKELDTVMNQISIVTDMDTSDLWGQVESYSAMAQKYGASIEGAYEVSKIYYQQGLETKDVLTLTNETLKLAKISGMDYAATTDYMTTALRGFKMEMQEASTVVDVYSNLASNTAVSQEELAIAMSKTASSMESVGATFQEASAMIATMVAVTRESSTNIGSALKSIASRYGELTKDPSALADSDGEAMSFNKVDTALQSVGISMKTTTGQFREFTDVIIELGEKWDKLESTQQRYIATQFAGNRQQSRFLALVSNVDLLKENISHAENSEDVGTIQALKALDSLDSKIKQVKVAYQQFYTTIGVDDVWKKFLNGLKEVINGLNDMPKLFGKLPIAATSAIIMVITAIKNIGIAGLTAVAKQLGPVISTGISSAKGEVQVAGEGLFNSLNQIILSKLGVAQNTGQQVSQAYMKGVQQGFINPNVKITSSQYTNWIDTLQGRGRFSALPQAFRNTMVANSIQKTNILSENELAKIREQGPEAVGILQALKGAIVQENAAATQGQSGIIGFINAHSKGLSSLQNFGAALQITALAIDQTGVAGKYASGFLTTLAGTFTLVGIAAKLVQGTLNSIPWVAVASAAIAVISGAVKVIDTFVHREEEKLEELKTKFEELEEAAKKEKANYNTISNSIKKYRELEAARYDSSEAMEEFNDVANKLGDTFPELISSFDEAGNVLINATELENVLTEARKASAEATLEAIRGEKEVIEQEKKIAQNNVTSGAETLASYGSKAKNIKNVQNWNNYNENAIKSWVIKRREGFTAEEDAEQNQAVGIFFKKMAEEAKNSNYDQVIEMYDNLQNYLENMGIELSTWGNAGINALIPNVRTAVSKESSLNTINKRLVSSYINAEYGDKELAWVDNKQLMNAATAAIYKDISTNKNNDFSDSNIETTIDELLSGFDQMWYSLSQSRRDQVLEMLSHPDKYTRSDISSVISDYITDADSWLYDIFDQNTETNTKALSKKVELLKDKGLNESYVTNFQSFFESQKEMSLNERDYWNTGLEQIQQLINEGESYTDFIGEFTRFYSELVKLPADMRNNVIQQFIDNGFTKEGLNATKHYIDSLEDVPDTFSDDSLTTMIENAVSNVNLTVNTIKDSFQSKWSDIDKFISKMTGGFDDSELSSVLSEAGTYGLTIDENAFTRVGDKLKLDLSAEDMEKYYQQIIDNYLNNFTDTADSIHELGVKVSHEAQKIVSSDGILSEENVLDFKKIFSGHFEEYFFQNENKQWQLRENVTQEQLLEAVLKYTTEEEDSINNLMKLLNEWKQAKLKEFEWKQGDYTSVGGYEHIKQLSQAGAEHVKDEDQQNAIKTYQAGWTSFLSDLQSYGVKYVKENLDAYEGIDFKQESIWNETSKTIDGSLLTLTNIAAKNAGKTVAEVNAAVGAAVAQMHIADTQPKALADLLSDGFSAEEFTTYMATYAPEKEIIQYFNEQTGDFIGVFEGLLEWDEETGNIKIAAGKSLEEVNQAFIKATGEGLDQLSHLYADLIDSQTKDAIEDADFKDVHKKNAVVLSELSKATVGSRIAVTGLSDKMQNKLKAADFEFTGDYIEITSESALNSLMHALTQLRNDPDLDVQETNALKGLEKYLQPAALSEIINETVSKEAAEAWAIATSAESAEAAMKALGYTWSDTANAYVQDLDESTDSIAEIQAQIDALDFGTDPQAEKKKNELQTKLNKLKSNKGAQQYSALNTIISNYQTVSDDAIKALADSLQLSVEKVQHYFRNNGNGTYTADITGIVNDINEGTLEVQEGVLALLGNTIGNTLSSILSALEDSIDGNVSGNYSQMAGKALEIYTKMSKEERAAIDNDFTKLVEFDKTTGQSKLTDYAVNTQYQQLLDDTYSSENAIIEAQQAFYEWLKRNQNNLSSYNDTESALNAFIKENPEYENLEDVLKDSEKTGGWKSLAKAGNFKAIEFKIKQAQEAVQSSMSNHVASIAKESLAAFDFESIFNGTAVQEESTHDLKNILEHLGVNPDNFTDAIYQDLLRGSFDSLNAILPEGNKIEDLLSADKKDALAKAHYDALGTALNELLTKEVGSYTRATTEILSTISGDTTEEKIASIKSIMDSSKEFTDAADIASRQQQIAKATGEKRAESLIELLTSGFTEEDFTQWVNENFLPEKRADQSIKLDHLVKENNKYVIKPGTSVQRVLEDFGITDLSIFGDDYLNKITAEWSEETASRYNELNAQARAVRQVNNILSTSLGEKISVADLGLKDINIADVEKTGNEIIINSEAGRKAFVEYLAGKKDSYKGQQQVLEAINNAAIQMQQTYSSSNAYEKLSSGTIDKASADIIALTLDASKTTEEVMEGFGYGWSNLGYYVVKNAERLDTVKSLIEKDENLKDLGPTAQSDYLSKIDSLKKNYSDVDQLYETLAASIGGTVSNEAYNILTNTFSFTEDYFESEGVSGKKLNVAKVIKDRKKLKIPDLVWNALSPNLASYYDNITGALSTATSYVLEGASSETDMDAFIERATALGMSVSRSDFSYDYVMQGWILDIDKLIEFRDLALSQLVGMDQDEIDAYGQILTAEAAKRKIDIKAFLGADNRDVGSLAYEALEKQLTDYYTLSDEFAEISLEEAHGDRYGENQIRQWNATRKDRIKAAVDADIEAIKGGGDGAIEAITRLSKEQGIELSPEELASYFKPIADRYEGYLDIIGGLTNGSYVAEGDLRDILQKVGMVNESGIVTNVDNVVQAYKEIYDYLSNNANSIYSTLEQRNKAYIQYFNSSYQKNIDILDVLQNAEGMSIEQLGTIANRYGKELGDIDGNLSQYGLSKNNFGKLFIDNWNTFAKQMFGEESLTTLVKDPEYISALKAANEAQITRHNQMKDMVVAEAQALSEIDLSKGTQQFDISAISAVSKESMETLATQFGATYANGLLTVTHETNLPGLLESLKATLSTYMNGNEIEELVDRVKQSSKIAKADAIKGLAENYKSLSTENLANFANAFGLDYDSLVEWIGEAEADGTYKLNYSKLNNLIGTYKDKVGDETYNALVQVMSEVTDDILGSITQATNLIYKGTTSFSEMQEFATKYSEAMGQQVGIDTLFRYDTLLNTFTLNAQGLQAFVEQQKKALEDLGMSEATINEYIQDQTINILQSNMNIQSFVTAKGGSVAQKEAGDKLVSAIQSWREYMGYTMDNSQEMIESYLSALQAGGLDAVNTLRLLKGDNVTDEEITAVYNAAMTPLRSTLDELGSSVGDIVSSYTGQLLQAAGATINDLGNGQAVIEGLPEGNFGTELANAYLKLYNRISITNGHTIADLNNAYAKAMEASEMAQSKPIEAIANASAMSYTQLGEYLAEQGINLFTALSDTAKYGIERVGAGKVRIADFTKFAAEMKWDTGTEEYIKNFKSYNDDLISYNNRISDEMKGELDALSQMTSKGQVNITRIASTYDLDKYLPQEELEAYGATLRDGILTLTESADIKGLTQKLGQLIVAEGGMTQKELNDLVTDLQTKKFQKTNESQINMASAYKDIISNYNSLSIETVGNIAKQLDTTYNDVIDKLNAVWQSDGTYKVDLAKLKQLAASATGALQQQLLEQIAGIENDLLSSITSASSFSSEGTTDISSMQKFVNDYNNLTNENRTIASSFEYDEALKAFTIDPEMLKIYIEKQKEELKKLGLSGDAIDHYIEDQIAGIQRASIDIGSLLDAQGQTERNKIGTSLIKQIQSLDNYEEIVNTAMNARFSDKLEAIEGKVGDELEKIQQQSILQVLTRGGQAAVELVRQIKGDEVTAEDISAAYSAGIDRLRTTLDEISVQAGNIVSEYTAVILNHVGITTTDLGNGTAVINEQDADVGTDKLVEAYTLLYATLKNNNEKTVADLNNAFAKILETAESKEADAIEALQNAASMTWTQLGEILEKAGKKLEDVYDDLESIGVEAIGAKKVRIFDFEAFAREMGYGKGSREYTEAFKSYNDGLINYDKEISSNIKNEINSLIDAKPGDQVNLTYLWSKYGQNTLNSLLDNFGATIFNGILQLEENANITGIITTLGQLASAAGDMIPSELAELEDAIAELLSNMADLISKGFDEGLNNADKQAVNEWAAAHDLEIGWQKTASGWKIVESSIWDCYNAVNDLSIAEGEALRTQIKQSKIEHNDYYADSQRTAAYIKDLQDELQYEEKLSEVWEATSRGEKVKAFARLNGNVDMTKRPHVQNSDGSYSTMLGTEYLNEQFGEQEVHILMTPIPEWAEVEDDYLSEDQLNDYLDQLMAQNPVDVQALLKLDQKGLEIDGKHFSNLMIDVQDAAEVTADEFQRMTEEVHDASEAWEDLRGVTEAPDNSERIAGLKEELALAREINAERATSKDDSFDFMNNKIPAGQENPLTYAQNLTKAFKAINDAYKVKNTYDVNAGGVNRTTTGYMAYEDFYNIVNELNHMAAVSGQAIQIGHTIEGNAYKLDGTLESASNFITEGIKTLTSVDSGEMMVNIGALGINLAKGGEELQSGIKEGVDAIADAEIAAIDAMIAVLEVIVAMEQLKEVDVDQDLEIDLGEMFKFKDANDPTSDIIGFTDKYEEIRQRLINMMAGNEDLQKAMDQVKINGHTMSDLINMGFEDLKAANVDLKAYNAAMSALYKAAMSNDYALDKVAESVKQVLIDSGINDLEVDIGDYSIIVRGGSISTIDWKSGQAQYVLEELKKQGFTQEDAKSHMSDIFSRYLNGDKINEIELEYVFRINGHYKFDKDNNITAITWDGHDIPITDTDNFKKAIAMNYIKDQGILNPDKAGLDSIDIKDGIGEYEVKVGSKTLKFKITFGKDGKSIDEAKFYAPGDDTPYDSIYDAQEQGYQAALQDLVNKNEAKNTEEAQKILSKDVYLYKQWNIRTKTEVKFAKDGKTIDINNFTGTDVRKELTELTPESLVNMAKLNEKTGNIDIQLPNTKATFTIPGEGIAIQADGTDTGEIDYSALLSYIQQYLLGQDLGLQENITAAVKEALKSLPEILQSMTDVKADGLNEVASAISNISDNASKAQTPIQELVKLLKELASLQAKPTIEVPKVEPPNPNKFPKPSDSKQPTTPSFENGDGPINKDLEQVLANVKKGTNEINQSLSDNFGKGLENAKLSDKADKPLTELGKEVDDKAGKAGESGGQTFVDKFSKELSNFANQLAPTIAAAAEGLKTASQPLGEAVVDGMLEGMNNFVKVLQQITPLLAAISVGIIVMSAAAKAALEPVDALLGEIYNKLIEIKNNSDIPIKISATDTASEVINKVLAKLKELKEKAGLGGSDEGGEGGNGKGNNQPLQNNPPETNTPQPSQQQGNFIPGANVQPNIQGEPVSLQGKQPTMKMAAEIASVDSSKLSKEQSTLPVEGEAKSITAAPSMKPVPAPMKAEAIELPKGDSKISLDAEINLPEIASQDLSQTITYESDFTPPEVPPISSTVTYNVEINGSPPGPAGPFDVVYNIHTNGTPPGAGGSKGTHVGYTLSATAKGNIGQARAQGTLVGELGPELIVEGNRYYTVGTNGPEFVNLPDDAIVFNHLQTKQLLDNGKTAGHGKVVTNERNAVAWAKGNLEGPAMASASAALAALKQLRAMWESLKGASVQDLAGAGGGGGGGGGGGDKAKIVDPRAWIDTVERWYNLMQEIAKLEQQITYQEQIRTKLQSDWQANGKAYFNSQKKSLDALNAEVAAQEQLNISRQMYFDKRVDALKESPLGKLYTWDEESGTMKFRDDVNINGKQGAMAFLTDLVGFDDIKGANYTNEQKYNILKANGFASYMKYDSNGMEIKMDEDNDGEVTDEERESYYEKATQAWWDKVNEFKEATESLHQAIEDGNVKIEELQTAINEELKAIRENQMEVEDAVLNAIEEARQREIDALQDQRDALEESVGKYIDGLSDALDKEREMYESEEAQDELNRNRRRLAILQRSGGSAADISALQDEIRTQERDLYFDAQQRQIDAIQEASDKEIERLDNQIDIMTEQLEYQKQYGLLWNDVYSIMDGSVEQIVAFISGETAAFWEKSPLANADEVNKTIFQAEYWKSYSDSVTNDMNLLATISRKQQEQKDYDTFNKQMIAEVGAGYDASGKYKKTFLDEYAKGMNLSEATNVARKQYYDDVERAKEAKRREEERKRQEEAKKAAAAPSGGGGGGGSSSADSTCKGTCSSYCGSHCSSGCKQNAQKPTSSVVACEPCSVTCANYCKAGSRADTLGLNRKKAAGGFVSHGIYELGERGTETVLTAQQTQILRNNILSNRPSSLISLLKTYNEGFSRMDTPLTGEVSTDNSITIENMNMTMDVKQISNDYDARRAGEQAMNEMLRIARKTSAANSIRR